MLNTLQYCSKTKQKKGCCCGYKTKPLQAANRVTFSSPLAGAVSPVALALPPAPFPPAVLLDYRSAAMGKKGLVRKADVTAANCSASLGRRTFFQHSFNIWKKRSEPGGEIP